MAVLRSMDKLLQCNNQMPDIVELFVPLCLGKRTADYHKCVFSIGKSDRACKNAEDLDVKDTDTSYL